MAMNKTKRKEDRVYKLKITYVNGSNRTLKGVYYHEFDGKRVVTYDTSHRVIDSVNNIKDVTIVS